MPIVRRQFLSTSAALALPSWVTTPAAAQATASGWPKQSVRFVVPFAPGGTSEIVARTVAHELTKQLGQTVFVDNKGGGAGIPAMQEVAKATPDGHTIILGHVGSLAVNPYIFPNQPYDVNKDFIPVTLLAKVPNLFVVHPDVPAKDFKEFVAYVKKHPGQLNYGSAGNASAGHLAMEYLKLVTGMFITHIPYRGTGPQLTDLLAGRTQASSAGLPAMLPQDGLADGEFLAWLQRWMCLSTVLNEVTLSLGEPAVYPFVISVKVAQKLRLAHHFAQVWKAPAPALPEPVQP